MLPRLCLLIVFAMALLARVSLADSSAEQIDTKALVAQIKTATDRATRADALGKLLAGGEQTTKLAAREIDSVLSSTGGEYARQLAPAITAAYKRKLEALSDQQVRHILRTRFLWEPYILNGGSHPEFRQVYLAPIWEMKAMLMPSVEEVLKAAPSPDLKPLRSKLTEFSSYQAQCYKALEIDPDPTVGKVSPTGIPYPPLDNPPTFIDRLNHFERTQILIHTVASDEARPLLMICDQVAREIDVQEAAYVLAANEVRMLAGSIAWRVDPLGCAVARDHSNDRKLGLAKGHMSDVPGKRGFSHRNKRMGAAFFGSEGVGGGKDGPSYLNGLSYSGAGHGGPLYRLARNRVGVGRREGAYTSQYGTDKKYIHPCPATEGTLWMPPGITPRDLSSSTTRRAASLMKNNLYGKAREVLQATGELSDVDAVAARFFRIAIDLKVTQAINKLKGTEKRGDVYLASVQLQQGMAQFSGIDAFANGVQPVAKRLQAEELSSELSAGREYHRFCANVKQLEKDEFDASRGEIVGRLQFIAESLPDSAYGRAAAQAAKKLSDPNSTADALLSYFE